LVSRNPEEAAILERFARLYPQLQSPARLEIERAVCGCDYGSTGWATRVEAARVGELLGLKPGQRLLDLGAGSGWPGLYLAQTSGCEVTLVDVPVEGMLIAAHRAAADGLAGKAMAVACDGARLAFGDHSFDAIEHSDVLCCLEAKSAVLAECRRVARPAARMVFSTISIAPALSASQRQRALEAGPPFMTVSSDYPEMLAATGWRKPRRIDLTGAYSAAVEKWCKAEEASTEALMQGAESSEFAEMIAKHRRTAAAIKDGLLQRELFATRAVG
jgi:ubiquinone/menaquinone biosynthesis C-methylase UbiE